MSDLHESREYSKVNLSNPSGQFDSYKVSTLVSSGKMHASMFVWKSPNTPRTYSNESTLEDSMRPEWYLVYVWFWTLK